MTMLSRITTSFFLFMISVVSVFAQADTESPYKVNGPTQKADQTFFDTPFLWIAIIVFALGGILLFLRKGQSATKNRLHKY